MTTRIREVRVCNGCHRDYSEVDMPIGFPYSITPSLEFAPNETVDVCQDCYDKGLRPCRLCKSAHSESTDDARHCMHEIASPGVSA